MLIINVVSTYLVMEVFCLVDILRNELQREYRHQILELLYSMNEIIMAGRGILQHAPAIGQLTNVLNSFIDAFVSLQNDSNIEKYLPESQYALADSLVNFIDFCNEKPLHDIRRTEILFHNLEVQFFTWYKQLMEIFRYKIIIYGAGVNNHSILLPLIFNKNYTQVIAHVTMPSETTCFGVQAIKAEDIIQYSYDYLFNLQGDQKLVALIEQGLISPDKIINFSRHYLLDADYNFYSKYYAFLDSNKQYEGLITGLSYAESGISEQFFSRRFCNFAVSSQDIFFDFHIAKFVLDSSICRQSIKYVIISLPIYAFGYDMSKSKSIVTERTEIYYPILGTLHNYPDAENFILEYEQYRLQMSMLCNDGYQRTLYEHIAPAYKQEINKVRTEKFNSLLLSDADKKAFFQQVNQESTKPYPLTISENKQLLKQYVEFLLELNIKPIIVVCPVSALVHENLLAHISDEFNTIISDLQAELDFQFLNYFSSTQFSDDDFFDPTHLNHQGSEKFTRMLEAEIIW